MNHDNYNNDNISFKKVLRIKTYCVCCLIVKKNIIGIPAQLPNIIPKLNLFVCITLVKDDIHVNLVNI